MNILRLGDQSIFKGYSWAREDGSFEAFWYEAGNRITLMFDSRGKQKGAWSQYRMQLKG